MSERYCVSYCFDRFYGRDIAFAYKTVRRLMRRRMAAGISTAYPKYKVIRKEIRWEDFGAKNGGGNGPPERAPKTLKSALFAFERPVLTICYWVEPI